MRYLWAAAVALVLVAIGAGDQPRPVSGKTGVEGGQLARGKYLAQDVAHCTHCHTPTTDKGELDTAQLLRGAPIPFEPKKKGVKWADMSPDITASGLAGEWTEEQMVTFLTTGKNPDGERATPPMPAFRFTPEDARAVTAFLRSVPGKKKGGPH